MQRIPLLMLLALSTSALAAPLCERALLAPDTRISVSDADGKTLSVTLAAQSARIECPDVPVNQKRLIQRYIKQLNAPRPLAVDVLIGFIASPWQSLSNSAGQQLVRDIQTKPDVLGTPQLRRLGGLVVTNQTSVFTAEMIVRIITKMRSAQAVKTLGAILRQSTRPSVQRAAARALGRFPQNEAHSLLKECAQTKDRMLSSRCKRSMIRWATQHASPMKRIDAVNTP